MNVQELIEKDGRVAVTTARGHTFMVPLKELVSQQEPVPDPEITEIDFSKIAIVDGQDPGTEGIAWVDSFRAWGTRTLDRGNDDQGVKRYVDGVTHVFNRNVGLTLLAQPHEGGFVAGMVSGEDLFEIEPGARFELEFRLNQIARGQHFAAWLLASDPKWPPEIDLLEFVNEPDRIYFASHHVDGSQGGPLTGIPFNGVGQWHKLTLDWMDRRTVWKLDGQIVRDVPTADIDEPMYPLFSWEIGQDTEKSWPGGPDETTVWPASITLRRMVLEAI